MNTIDELKARKSVRVFEERTISEEIKEQLYTAAFEAPTAGKQRPAIISSGSRRRSWPSSSWRITAAGSTCMRQPAVRRAVLASATCGWR